MKSPLNCRSLGFARDDKGEGGGDMEGGGWTQVEEKRLLSSDRSPRNRFLSFVIPSEVEGSAVQRTFRGNVFSTVSSSSSFGSRFRALALLL
jgi:hypothetical protein